MIRQSERTNRAINFKGICGAMPMLLAGYQKGQVGKMNGFLFFRHSIFHSGDTSSPLSSSKTVGYVLWMQSAPIQSCILLFQRKEFNVFMFSCNSSKSRLLPEWQPAVGLQGDAHCSSLLLHCIQHVRAQEWNFLPRIHQAVGSSKVRPRSLFSKSWNLLISVFANAREKSMRDS